MADGIAEEINRLGWRQGSVLGMALLAQARVYAPKSLSIGETDWLIVTTHDCDVLNGDIQKEPVVEVLRFEVGGGRNRQIEGGRSPRLLHLDVEEADQHVFLHGRVHERWAIPRELLRTEAPRTCLRSDLKCLVREWLAKRYIRSAFPSAFDNRWRKARNVWEKLLRKFSPRIQGIYLRLNSLEELMEDQPYRCDLIVAVPANQRKASDWPEVREQIEVDIAGFWEQFNPGIICDEVDVLGTDEITLAVLENNYQRFDADWLSFEDDSATTPVSLDMRT